MTIAKRHIHSLIRIMGIAGTLAVFYYYGWPVLYAFTYTRAIETETGIVPTMAGIFMSLAFTVMIILIIIPMLRKTNHRFIVLLLAFLWGVSSIALHTQLIILLQSLFGTFDAHASDLVGGGIMEEVGKGLFLLGAFLVGNRYFRNIGTGFVLGWFVGAGFGFLENISYFTSFIEEEQYVGAFVRAVIGLAGSHALYTGLTGASIGYIHICFNRTVAILLSPLAVLPGIFLHMTNNGLFIPVFGEEIGAILTILLIVVVFIFMLVFFPRRQLFWKTKD